MRRSFTAVLEKNATFTTDFATEPYEAAWASEARWFVRVVEIQGQNAQLRLTPQVSPDGIEWCDEGSAPLKMVQPGLKSTALRDFGHWLRLVGELLGKDARVQLRVVLALKE